MNPPEYEAPPQAANLVVNGIMTEAVFLQERQADRKIKHAESQRQTAETRAAELAAQNQAIRDERTNARRKAKIRAWLSPIIGL